LVTLGGDVAILNSLGSLEEEVGGIIMTTITELQQANRQLSDEEKKTFCALISGWLQKLCKMSPTDISESENKCSQLVQDEKLDKVRAHLGGLIQEQRKNILMKEIQLEKASMSVSLYVLVRNLYVIFTKMENMKIENEVQRAGFRKTIAKYRDRLNKRIAEYQRHNDRQLVLEHVAELVDDVEQFVKSIQIVTDKHASLRNASIIEGATSFFRLAACVTRAVVLRDLSSAADVALFVGSAATHAVAGGTSIFLAVEYAHQVEEFQVVLREAKFLLVETAAFHDDLKSTK